MTPATITALPVLNGQLDWIRQSGIAFNRGELAPGLVCVAAPVFGPSGRPIAALTLTGKNNQMDQGAIVRRLRHAALTLSQAAKSAYSVALRADPNVY